MNGKCCVFTPALDLMVGFLLTIDQCGPSLFESTKANKLLNKQTIHNLVYCYSQLGLIKFVELHT